MSAKNFGGGAKYFFGRNVQQDNQLARLNRWRFPMEPFYETNPGILGSRIGNSQP